MKSIRRRSALSCRPGSAAGKPLPAGRAVARLAAGLFTLLALLLPAMAQALNQITDIEFTSRPGSKFEVRLDFDAPPPQDLRAYTIENPARIAIDFPDTGSQLPRKNYRLSYGNATGVLVLEAEGRTRMVVNLVRLVPYDTRVDGNSLFVTVGQESEGEYFKATSDPYAVGTGSAQVLNPRASIEDLQFQRGADGEGRLLLELSDPAIDINVFSERGDVKVEFLQTDVPERLQRNYDVTDFATPVQSVTVNASERGAALTLNVAGEFDYLAYQADEQYVVSVKPLSPEEVEQRRNEFSFVGERISLNFQDIEVRAVLQLIADFTELNLVASDTVSGRITLRLKNVPWDQALELVLKTKGLDKRQVGNVLLVAPAQEIAERERQEIEANKQIAELAPLRSEFIRIRYAKAADLVQLFEAGSEEGGTLISSRGSVIVEPRTNSLIVTETASKLAEIRRLIDEVDTPIRQVMIEARIVIAQSDIEEELGIRWGGGYLNDDVDGNILSISGDATNAINLGNAAINGVQPVITGDQGTGTGGTGGGTTDQPGLSFPGALMVDLGTQRTSGFAIGFTAEDLFLSAELSALEAAGKSEVVSQPKVITGDKQKANIKSGTEIPFQQAAASGATAVQFKEAVLSLDVTPNITPDNRILLDLLITQDSVGDLVPTGQGGLIPAIDTTELTTQVLVGNGETVVLGGVFRTEDVESRSKVPFFGDIPYVGALFRSEVTQQTKTETLIFITPRILANSLLD